MLFVRPSPITSHRMYIKSEHDLQPRMYLGCSYLCSRPCLAMASDSLRQKALEEILSDTKRAAARAEVR